MMLETIHGEERPWFRAHAALGDIELEVGIEVIGADRPGGAVDITRQCFES